MKDVLWRGIALIFLMTFGLTAGEKPSVLNTISKTDLEAVFRDYGVTGCCIVQHHETGVEWVHNAPRTDKAFLPASTFKIINSMIALETGVIKDEKEVIKWDGKKRFIEAWNQDHDLGSAFRHSVVWVYQDLARRIGEERMAQWVNKARYGNQDISGRIDTFWLEGGIRITPRQQIEFIKRLYTDQLPFSKRVTDIVKGIMILEETPQYVFRAKTGWTARVTPQIGWFVGYLQMKPQKDMEKGDVYFFAVNIDMNQNDDGKARMGITRDVFKKMGLLPR